MKLGLDSLRSRVVLAQRAERRQLGRSEGRRSASVAWLSLGILAGLGCQAPKIELRDCQSTCNDDTGCPKDMECRENYCVHPDRQGACAAAGASNVGRGAGGDKASNASASAWASASAPASGGTGALGGSGAAANLANSNESGTPGLGGSAGSTGASVGVAGSRALSISAPVSSAWCTGQEITNQLSVLGGLPPYAWSAASPPSGIGFVGSGGTASLSGIPTKSGSYDPAVVVADSSGNHAAYAVRVYDTPAITTDLSALEQGCVGQVFEVELAASGYQPSELEWSTTLDPAMGLSLEANKLSGQLTRGGRYTYSISACNRVAGCCFTKQIETNVSEDSSPSCPSIGVEARHLAQMPAPAFCSGWPYDVTFKVFHPGAAVFHWRALAHPLGLSFDSATATFTGVPAASGPITLQIVDDLGRVFQKTYQDVPMRDKCWFAFLDGATGAERIHLVDPQLGRRLEPPLSGASTSAVLDFEFSPDGKFLAYRVTRTSGLVQLWLWQGPAWDREKLLEFKPGSNVTHYAWSGDSKVLAVAYELSNGSVELGGVDVSTVLNAPAVPGIQGLADIGAETASVGSELVWYGKNDRVAFYGPLDPAYLEELHVMFSKLEGSRFSKPVPITTDVFESSVRLVPSSSGFFAAQQNALKDPTPQTRIYFFGSKPTAHGNVAISPSGNFVAAVREGELWLYRSDMPSVRTEDAAVAVQSGCSNLLAWAEQRELIACTDVTVAQAGIRAFTWGAASPAELTSGMVQKSSELPARSWSGHGRRMSPSGNWLALATDDELYMISLGNASQQLAWTRLYYDSQKNTGLSFSPDEKMVAIQRGRSLRIYDTAHRESVGLYVERLGADVAECQEHRLHESTWCGGPGAPVQLSWSPDSNLVAMQLETGALVIRDLRTLAQDVFDDAITVVDACVGGCLEEFQFQP